MTTPASPFFQAAEQGRAARRHNRRSPAHRAANADEGLGAEPPEGPPPGRSRPRDRKFYLDLSASGLRMPIGTDLVLREHPDAEAILLDGRRLGAVVVQAAARYRTPLALPLMDLTLEKELLLVALGIPAQEAARYHFDAPPCDEMLASIDRRLAGLELPRFRAHVEAIRHVAAHSDLVAMGMAIGPFSLMTKLLAEPIVPVYKAGSGVRADQDDEVAAVQRCLELATCTVLFSVARQIEAGAEAIFIAEPAANQFYISPRQLEAGSDVFERYVVQPNRCLREVMAAAGVQLMFHCCGDITDQMLAYFAGLRPTILSLGSSRRLWEDAARVPADTILFGNLPSKKFFMDSEITVEQVRQMGCDLLRRMREARHPFILGSECDVLSVEGYEAPIRRKVEALLSCE